jgi:hypothetical protein
MKQRQSQQKAKKPRLRERTKKVLASAARSLRRVFLGDWLDEKLHRAIKGHIPETERHARIERLLKAGANINSKFVYGRTVLRWAAMLGLTNTCAFLLEKGADINVRNDFGETAAEAAQIGNKPETASFLKLMESMETGQRISFLSNFRECVQ